jgi:23S rRNA (uracil1939-C5)-methyltransferase
MKRGDIVELEISSPAFEGSSVGRIDNLVVFVPYAVPGDRIRARITRKKRKYAEGVIEEILEPSGDRTEPRCIHFGTCGGCSLQNARYEKQLEYKQLQVQALMERIGGFKEVEVKPVIPSQQQFEYRNKMEYTFGAQRWLTAEEIASGEKFSRDFALGLHIPKRFDRILDLTECHLQDPESMKILDTCRTTAVDRGWLPYNVINHTGYLRNLIVRRGINTGELMVNLVTTSKDSEKTELLSQILLENIPSITTILNSINPGPNPSTMEEEIILFGDGKLTDRIGDTTYQISPFSFFQPNTRQAEILFSTIRDAAALEGTEILYDLYCGLGAIGIYLAGMVKKVIGVESHSRSVELARNNAKINGAADCHFFDMDVLEALSHEFLAENGKPNLVVLDPPRAGLHPKVVSSLLETAPDRIVYTSCNPATQARDLNLLGADYDLGTVQPVDMFPQTWHIESVATLCRRKV